MLLLKKKCKVPERPPVEEAVANALHIKSSGAPLPGCWRGCPKGFWCNRENRHRGLCNYRALVPGPAAYTVLELLAGGMSPDEASLHLRTKLDLLLGAHV